MLKAAIEASSDLTDATSNVLLSRIDHIRGIIFNLERVEYQPPLVGSKVGDKASEEAITAAYLERPVLPTTSPTAINPIETAVVVSQLSSSNDSQQANASLSPKDAALLLQQKTAMTYTNGCK